MTPHSTRQSAATYIPVTLEEMGKVIQRGFRAMDPKVGRSQYGEVIYDLTPDDEDPDTIIRIQTSIFQGSQARGEGQDSIRVTILNRRTMKPITGKYQRVHRTQNWKDNLRSRIEDAIEEVEELGEQRAKARDLAQQRAEQDQQREQSPEEFRAERRRQGLMLEDLAEAEADGRTKGPFTDMRDRLFNNKTKLLTEAQLAWVEREHRRLFP